MINPLAPWTHPGRLFRASSSVALALPIGIVTFVVVFVSAVLSIALMPLFLLGIPMAWVWLTASRKLAQFERSRLATFDRPIADSVPPLTRTTWIGRLNERLHSKPRWREIAHHLLMLPIGTAGFAVAYGVWSGAVMLLSLPLVAGRLPGDSAKMYFFDIDAGVDAWIAALVGLIGLVVLAPWITIAVAAVQHAIARRLLGPNENEALALEVARLQTSRAAAVDAGERERRRIERDLHDGAQQRLVALAADLGAAKERLERDPDGARDLVAAAHEEAKAALQEIRDLVRGIHPVILEDRGLDPALSAIVARLPIPVSVDVKVPERPPAAVESAAYFVVAESLMNVHRHSGASRAWVDVVRAGDRLVIEVRDDGHGGADPSRGSGLRGLHDRVTGLGGSMLVISPEGGPTTISVELPCGS